MFWQIIIILFCSISFVWAEIFSPSYKPETKGKDLYSEAHKIYRSSPAPDNGVYEYGNLFFSVVQIDTKKENVKYLEATAMLRVVAQLRTQMPNLPMQFSTRSKLLEKGMDDDTEIYRYAVVFRKEDLIFVTKQEEARKQEELKKQQEEARKQEVLKKQQEEARKQEELKKQQEEARKQEELKKQQEQAQKKQQQSVNPEATNRPPVQTTEDKEENKKAQETKTYHNEIQSNQDAHDNANSLDSQKPAIAPKNNTIYDDVKSTEPINKIKQDKDKSWINVQMMIE